MNGNGTKVNLINHLIKENSNWKSSLKHLTEEKKIELISEKFRDIMLILGLDLNDDSLEATPQRVAKMYVKEVFQGLNPSNKPEVKLFKNTYQYDQMLIEKNIKVKSFCEHHFVPIIGKAHVAYFPDQYVAGLSKLNRIVDFYCRRPQVQERLTNQIAEELKKSLKTEHIAVLIEAEHMCVSLRGVEDESSSTVTSHFSGLFEQKEIRKEFFQQLNLKI